MCNITFFVLYSKFFQDSELWKQFELTSELDKMNWAGSCFWVFSLGKNILVSLNYSNKSGAFDLNVNGSICKKNCFEIMRLPFTA